MVEICCFVGWVVGELGGDGDGDAVMVDVGGSEGEKRERRKGRTAKKEFN